VDLEQLDPVRVRRERRELLVGPHHAKRHGTALEGPLDEAVEVRGDDVLQVPAGGELRDAVVVGVRLTVVQRPQGLEVGRGGVGEHARHELRRHAALARLREHVDGRETRDVARSDGVTARHRGDRQVAQVVPVGQAGRRILADARAAEERDLPGLEEASGRGSPILRLPRLSGAACRRPQRLVLPSRYRAAPPSSMKKHEAGVRESEPR
jgi:hypothetical protein